jgi:hypothetical protein
MVIGLGHLLSFQNGFLSSLRVSVDSHKYFSNFIVTMISLPTQQKRRWHHGQRLFYLYFSFACLIAANKVSDWIIISLKVATWIISLKCPITQ